MIHEFAVDPEALAGWQNFRFIDSHFGISQGRLISRFPGKKWKSLVYAACGDCLPVEKARIEVRLREIDAKLFAAGREYDSNQKWIANAKASHGERPFRSVITTAGQATGGSFLDVEELEASDPIWGISTADAVPRRACDLCAASAMLLKCSTEIIFVDPHFSFTAKHGNPLTEFLKCAFDGSPPKRVEYHLKANGKSSDWFSTKLNEQRRFLRIPEGAQIVFVRWDQIAGGENLHPRYVLTERGGIHYDYGLDEGDEGETTDVQLLSEELHRERWHQFQPDSGAFTMVDAWAVTADSVFEAEYVDGGFKPKV